MMKKREELIGLHTACIRAVSPSRRLPRLTGPKGGRILPDYFLYSNETDDTVWVDPDTPEWFCWLDGLTSFDFDGRDGDFVAYKQSPNSLGEPALFPGRPGAKVAWEGRREPRRQPISWTKPMVWEPEHKHVEPSVRAFAPRVVLARV